LKRASTAAFADVTSAATLVGASAKCEFASVCSLVAARSGLPVERNAGRALEGRFRPPGDKSMSHRAFIFGLLSCGETMVEGLLEDASEDRKRWKSAYDAYFPSEADRANAIFVEVDVERMELWIRGELGATVGGVRRRAGGARARDAAARYPDTAAKGMAQERFATTLNGPVRISSNRRCFE
jgi:hypothetical protein